MPEQRMHQVYARIGAPACASCGQRCNASGYAAWPREDPPIEITLWHCVNRDCSQLEVSVRKITPYVAR